MSAPPAAAMMALPMATALVDLRVSSAVLTAALLTGSGAASVAASAASMASSEVCLAEASGPTAPRGIPRQAGLLPISQPRQTGVVGPVQALQ